MIKNSKSPASPFYEIKGMVNGVPTSYENHKGLTKREMFAMHAMQAWIQHHGTRGGYGFSAEDAAASAVECADALLKELDK